MSQQNSITSAQPGRFYVRSAKIRLCVFMHPVRDQQIALAPPADFAVLGVRFESRRIGKLKLMRQDNIVCAKILIAKAVGSIEMLINAEEPRVLGGPILNAGIAAMAEYGTPPPRTVIASPSRPSGWERSHNLGRQHQRVSSIRRRDAAVHPRARRRRARDARARSAACAPAPRPTSCAPMAHSPFAADTIRRAHCPSGT